MGERLKGVPLQLPVDGQVYNLELQGVKHLNGKQYAIIFELK